MTLDSTEQEIPELRGAAFFAECMKALRGFPSAARALILSPSRFFKSPAFEEPPEYRLAQATTFLFVTAVMVTITDYIAFYSGEITYYLPQIVQKVLALIGWNYVFAMVMHIVLKIFRSKGAFIDTLVSANYCSAQFIVVGICNLIVATMRVVRNTLRRFQQIVSAVVCFLLRRPLIIDFADGLAALRLLHFYSRYSSLA